MCPSLEVVADDALEAEMWMRKYSSAEISSVSLQDLSVFYLKYSLAMLDDTVYQQT